MAFEKGRSGNPKGRPRGSPNKLTLTVKQAFQDCFDGLQAVPGARLSDWAKENPTEFYKLAARLIPQDSTVTVKADAREYSTDELLDQLASAGVIKQAEVSEEPKGIH